MHISYFISPKSLAVNRNFYNECTMFIRISRSGALAESQCALFMLANLAGIQKLSVHCNGCSMARFALIWRKT